jgi:hypothetical protein
MSKRFISLLSLTVLSACCEKQAAPQVFQHANLTKKCDDAPAFEGKTSDDLVDAHLGLTGQYEDCKTRHNALVDSLKP